VASVKLGDPMSPGTSFSLQPGGGINIDGASLKSLILYAYDLREFQLSGAMGWMNSERYTIRAKGVMSGPSNFSRMNDQQQKAMFTLVRKRLQALLEERFQLAAHRQAKELPVYGLVLAKGGSKLEPNLSPDGSTRSMTTGRAMFKATRASMDAITQALAGIVGRPVQDETGLTGYFDLKLEWTPDPAPGAGSERPAETVGPTLFTEIQEQLGLRLVARKGNVDVLVIDRAERPSEN